MSSHVDDWTLQLLHDLQGPSYPWLAKFHQQHWGRTNGTSVTFDNCGTPQTITCINNPFDLLLPSPLLVRKCYPDLWNYLCRTWFNFNRPNPLCYGTIILGDSGIGKSISLYFLMCAAAERRIPFGFHQNGASDAFVCLDVGSFFIPAAHMSKICFKQPGLVLVDACAGELRYPRYGAPQSHVVLASSSSPTLGQYRQFYKSTGAMYFSMSPLDEAESRAMLHLRTLQPDDLAPLVPTVALCPEPPNEGAYASSHGQDRTVRPAGGLHPLPAA